MLFVTPSYQFDNNATDKRYTLVLSPHYYWCKKSLRSFKNSTQAKKFAASMFELDGNYSYDVYTHDGELFFVAFDTKRIEKMLLDQGFDLGQVEKIYLAQAFFNDFKNPIAINETEALARINGVVVVVKKSLCTKLDDENELSTFAQQNMRALKVKGLGRQNIGGLGRPLIALGSVAALWMITTFINLFMTQNELMAKQEALKSSYHLPETSFQLKSMVRRLEKIDKQQSFIRGVLHGLTQDKAIFDASLQSIRLNTKQLELKIVKSLDEASQRALQKRLKSHAKSVTFSVKNRQSYLKVVR
jgi:hypothetical protein